MRADLLLVHLGLAASRSQAQRLLAGGARWLSGSGWKPLTKSCEVPETAHIELADRSEAQFVSRGGLKLAGAMKTSGLNSAGLFCLDIGQSTGGFTDCLLQGGAAHVLGVDVGKGQLHPRLSSDPRVTCIEGVNARSTCGGELFELALAQGTALTMPVDANATKNIANKNRGCWTKCQKNHFFELLVGDVSFISQTLVLTALRTLLAPKAQVLMLVKPQFELQPGQLAKGGIVKDAALYAVVEARIRAAYAANAFAVQGYFESAIAGGDGNREFFVHAVCA